MFVRTALLAAAASLALAACSPSYQPAPQVVYQPVPVQAAPVQPVYQDPYPTAVYQAQPVYQNNGSDAVALAVLAHAAAYAIGSYNPRYGYVDHYDMYHHPIYSRTRVTHVTNVTNVTNVRNVNNQRNVSAPAPRPAPVAAPAPRPQQYRAAPAPAPRPTARAGQSAFSGGTAAKKR